MKAWGGRGRLPEHQRRTTTRDQGDQERLPRLGTENGPRVILEVLGLRPRCLRNAIEYSPIRTRFAEYVQTCCMAKGQN
jgi:hypothetical protein